MFGKKKIKTYKCALCGETFPDNSPEQEERAIEEYHRIHGEDAKLEDASPVCPACFLLLSFATNGFTRRAGREGMQ